MSDTALSIITTSLQEIGAYSPGDTIDDSDAELALDLLNQMLEYWSTESLSCFAILEQNFPLVVAKQQYTIGTTGTPDVTATRPVRLIQGPGAAYAKDAGGQRYEVEVMERDRWNLIGFLGATSNVPSTIFYDPQFPLGVLNVFPIPNAAGMTLYFDSFQQLTALANLATAFSFPPGYKPTVQSNLSVWLGPFFKNATVSADVKRRARITLMALKRANRRTPIGQLDSAVISRAQPTYNIFTDSRGS